MAFPFEGLRFTREQKVSVALSAQSEAIWARGHKRVVDPPFVHRKHNHKVATSEALVRWPQPSARASVCSKCDLWHKFFGWVPPTLFLPSGP